MEWWEILLIIRGYYHRNILLYQLQRIQAFSAFYAFSGNKNKVEPQEWLPLYFDKYRITTGELLSDEEQAEIRKEMEDISRSLQESEGREVDT